MQRTVHSNGRQMSYLEAGRGRPVVLLHPFPLNAEYWRPQLEAVPPGWRIVAPDLRGFGRARFDADAGPAPAMMEDYASDVAALIDALGIERAVIGGLSMGGYVAFVLFRRAAKRVGTLMLADTRARPDTDDGRAGRRRMQELAEREGAAGVAREMLPKLLGRTTQRARPAVVARVREMIEQADPAAIAAALGCMMTRADSRPLLPEIRCPTLIVVGEEDSLTPPADSEEMHRQIEGSRLAIVPAAGHLSSLERPAEFNAALAGFLDERC